MQRPDVGPAAPPFGAVAGLYTAAFVLLAWPWLSGAVTIPWDAKAQFQSELQFLAASLAHGESPFWTPNVFAGWPQIADPQSLIFSPLHLLLAWLDPAPSFREADAVTFGYLFCGGIGVILLFRERGWHPAGALVAALAFAFGGSASSRLQHTSEIISLSYLPIALWLLARTLDRASWRTGLACGLAMGFLAIGRDQVALLGLYVLGLYVLVFWLDGAGRFGRMRRSVLPLAAAALITFAVAIVPVTLSALLAADSNRPTVGFADAAGGSLHPVLLLMLVFADLFGAADPKVDFWGPPSFPWSAAFGPSGIALAQNMGAIYCGILAVILIIGTGIGRGLAWAKDVRFFSIALVLTLLYAVGWNTPVFHLMYDVMPGVDLFRRPADATFVIGFLIAVLAGYLVHRTMTGTASRTHRTPLLECVLIAALAAGAAALAYAAKNLGVAALPIATGVGFGLAGIALLGAVWRLGPRHPLLATALLVVFMTADLRWNNAPNESTGLPPEIYTALRPGDADETVALLRKKLAETAGPDRRDRVELIGIAYHWPDVALAQGFDHLYGHNPLRLRDFAAATGVGDTVATPAQRTFAPLYPIYRSAFADLCGVRFIATGVPVEKIDPALRPGDLDFVARTRDAYVYENPRALPRVMFVHDHRVVNFQTVLRDGWPADIDPNRTVLLDHAPDSLEHAPATSPDAAGKGGTARLLRYANTEVDVAVDSPAGGFLLLTDVWHPWWRATIDGRPAEILKADVIFRGIQVGAGQHVVSFRFEPFAGAWEELKQTIAPK